MLANANGFRFFARSWALVTGWSTFDVLNLDVFHGTNERTHRLGVYEPLNLRRSAVPTFRAEHSSTDAIQMIQVSPHLLAQPSGIPQLLQRSFEFAHRPARARPAQADRRRRFASSLEPGDVEAIAYARRSTHR
jgi:hypothetical protein